MLKRVIKYVLIYALILSAIIIFAEPKNADYLVKSRGITCWNCSHEITGEFCDNCSADVMKYGLLTKQEYICKNCGKQLFWTYSGRCYYCNEPVDESISFPKFSSVFKSYADYKSQLSKLNIFIAVLIIYSLVYILVTIKLERGIRKNEK